MDFFFYVAVIAGMGILYAGYESKKSYKLREKQLRVEERRIELEKLKVEKGVYVSPDTEKLNEQSNTKEAN